MKVEQKIKTCTDKAATLSNDAATKQINSLNKICNSLISQIQNKRDEWRNEESKKPADNLLKISAI